MPVDDRAIGKSHNRDAEAMPLDRIHHSVDDVIVFARIAFERNEACDRPDFNGQNRN